MKIITVNLPKPYIDALNRLIGENALYPSRSEAIRVAVREYLIRELDAASDFLKIRDKRSSSAPNTADYLSEMQQKPFPLDLLTVNGQSFLFSHLDRKYHQIGKA